MDDRSGHVRDNLQRSRFELSVDGQVAIAEYRIKDGAIFFTHTETPPALRGQGVASQLAAGAFAAARAQGLKIVPLCSFMVEYLDRHPEYRA